MATWVELGPGGQPLARAIVRAPSCPAVLIDGTSREMSLRAAPRPSFPERVCELALPAGTRSARLGAHALPLPKADPRRIVVLGDSGCRLKKKVLQACNDLDQWPFAQVAARAADDAPDLVIHVGDYVYRERECPEGNEGCAASPFGDRLDTWVADFFAPARPLLAAAPWIMARGNHESCQRAGGGFLRLLDPRPVPAQCSDRTGPYAVPLGSRSLVVLDSSGVVDEHPSAADVARARADIATAPFSKDAPAWLVSHHPPFGVEANLKRKGELRAPGASLRAASDLLPRSLELILSGHIHLYELVKLEHGPVQAVAGTGGTELDPEPELTVERVAAALGVPVSFARARASFGYLLLEREADGVWVADLRDENGSCALRCRLEASGPRCGAVRP